MYSLLQNTNIYLKSTNYFLPNLILLRYNVFMNTNFINFVVSIC